MHDAEVSDMDYLRSRMRTTFSSSDSDAEEAPVSGSDGDGSGSVSGWACLHPAPVVTVAGRMSESAAWAKQAVSLRAAGNCRIRLGPAHDYGSTAPESLLDCRDDTPAVSTPEPGADGEDDADGEARADLDVRRRSNSEASTTSHASGTHAHQLQV